jgi:hypothetical protein
LGFLYERSDGINLIWTTFTIRKKKRIRIGFINNLAPVIQPVLKVSGAKYFITGVKIKTLEPVL